MRKRGHGPEFLGGTRIAPGDGSRNTHGQDKEHERRETTQHETIHRSDLERGARCCFGRLRIGGHNVGKAIRNKLPKWLGGRDKQTWVRAPGAGQRPPQLPPVGAGATGGWGSVTSAIHRPYSTPSRPGTPASPARPGRLFVTNPDSASTTSSRSSSRSRRRG